MELVHQLWANSIPTIVVACLTPFPYKMVGERRGQGLGREGTYLSYVHINLYTEEVHLFFVHLLSPSSTAAPVPMQ